MAGIATSRPVMAASRFRALVALVWLVVTSCNGAHHAPRSKASTPLARALAWCDQPSLEAPSSLVLASLQRAYGLRLAHDPRAIFAKRVAEMRAVGKTGAAGTLALLRRVYDGSVRIEPEFMSLANSTDQHTLVALYCDTAAPPPNFRDALMAAVERGGYQATHVLLAALFLRSNGCTGILSADDRARIHARVAALIRLDDGSLDDLDVEAMTFLAADGRADLVPAAARVALLASQQADGSWRNHTPLGVHLEPSAGFQHTSVLALWFLLLERSGSAFVPMSPPAS
ncbi:MAG: hypothetical protein ACXWVM_29565 [Polyangiales bacterium]